MTWIQLSSTFKDEKDYLQELDRLLSGFIKEARELQSNSIFLLVGTQGYKAGQVQALEGLHQDILQIPMIFCTRSSHGGVYPELVRHVDVMNSLLSQVPLSNQKDSDGADLFGLRVNTKFTGFNTVVFGDKTSREALIKDVAIYAVNNKQGRLYKYLYESVHQSEALYDLINDPLETRDISKEKSNIRDQLHKQALDSLAAFKRSTQ